MIRYTIVGGFLGAGKTSLINSVLRTATERIAVVVNDLGDISLDADLIRASTGDADDDVIELANGCLCCSIGDSLAVTLRDLCLRSPAPEHIVVECSGAAEPRRVARYGSRKVLAEPTIVTVVDATDIAQRSTDRRFADLVQAQLSAAHVLVLSKTDLVSADQLHTTRDWLHATHPAATIVIGHPAQLGGPMADGFEPHPTAEVGPAADQVFATETLYFDTPMSAEQLTDLLAPIPSLVRAKGLVAAPDGITLVQWAAGHLDISPWSGPAPDRSWLTVIRAASNAPNPAVTQNHLRSGD